MKMYTTFNVVNKIKFKTMIKKLRYAGLKSKMIKNAATSPAKLIKRNLK
jgi:hypothetical protein